MDMRKEPKYRVLVEREGYSFFVDLDYENIPDFCHYCNIVGHAQSYCRRAKADAEKNKPDSRNPPRTDSIQKEVNVYKVVKDRRKDKLMEQNDVETLLVAQNEDQMRDNEDIQNSAQDIATTTDINSNWQYEKDNDSNPSDFVDSS